ncbi:MAG: anti-sigma factor [Pseudonocardia sp.]|nr:anti-sigma factor [Pseudonocardia sp.]
MTGPDIHALSGAYALDAVDDLERAAFDRHLAECEACAVEVAEYRETATRLAEGSWSVPPPRMREQVLARAAATPQLPPNGHRRGVASPVARWRRLAVAAAAVGVLGLGAAATAYAALEQRLDAERTAMAVAQQRQEVMTAPDAALRAGDLAGGGRVTVVVSELEDNGVVILNGAPPPGPDRVYQLWLVPEGSGTPVSVGLLRAGQTGAIELIQGVRRGATLAVSLEPAGGSPVPSTTPLVGIPLV